MSSEGFKAKIKNAKIGRITIDLIIISQMAISIFGTRWPTYNVAIKIRMAFRELILRG